MFEDDHGRRGELRRLRLQRDAGQQQGDAEGEPYRRIGVVLGVRHGGRGQHRSLEQGADLEREIGERQHDRGDRGGDVDRRRPGVADDARLV